MPPLSLSVTMYQITVTFNAAAIDNPTGPPLFTYSEPSPLSVSAGVGMVVFMLETANGNGNLATFLSSPIQWFDQGADGQLTSIPQPAAFLVQWFDTSHFTVLDFNSAQVQNQHPYNLVVSYGGQIYGSEPVIINEPAGGPPPRPARSHRR